MGRLATETDMKLKWNILAAPSRLPVNSAAPGQTS